MTNKKQESNASFFRLISGKHGGVNEFKIYIEDVFSKLKSKSYDEIEDVEINRDIYYIESIQKRMVEEKKGIDNMYYYLICLSRIELDNAVELGDATIKIREKRRRPAEKTDNEGLIVDKRFIFDPFRDIIITYNRRGSINHDDLRRFIYKSVHKRGISLEIILAKEGYDRIVNLDETTTIKYTVASPNKFDAFKDENRAEHKDMEYARYFGAERAKVELVADQLNGKNVIHKVKSLLNFNSKGDKVTSLIVEGYKDGNKDRINIISNKLEYKGTIEYEGDLDSKAIFGFLNEAHDENIDYLQTIFKI